jgi:hypothetical protein
VPASFIDLNSMVYVASWILIGLIVYWAEGERRPVGKQWLAAYIVLGALMLPIFVWRYLSRAQRANRGRQSRTRLNTSKPALATSPAVDDPAPTMNPKKLRKKAGGMGPRKR